MGAAVTRGGGPSFPPRRAPPLRGRAAGRESPGALIPVRSSPCPGARRLSRSSAISGPPNIAAHLTRMAQRQPYTLAVVAPAGRARSGRTRYVHLTYRQLDEDSDRIALGLQALGIAPGTRAVLMVRPGLDLFALVFAVFKAGVVPVLIDPGIGLRNLGQCCREAAPEVFIGIPKAVWAHRILGWGRETVRQVIRVAPGRTRQVRSGVKTLDDVRRLGREALERGLDA